MSWPYNVDVNMFCLSIFFTGLADIILEVFALLGELSSLSISLFERLICYFSELFPRFIFLSTWASLVV